MGIDDVDVVILNYRVATYAVEAARSALRNGASSIMVVDSHSEDDSLEVLEREIGDFVTIAPMFRNSGFAAGNNYGASLGTRPFVLFMNADALLHEKALESMLKVFENSRTIGAVAPALFYPNGSPQASAYLFITPRRLANSLLGLGRLADTWKLPIFSSNHDHRRNGDYSGIVESLYGPCFLVRRSAFDAVGGFDEAFFLYCEETDFFLRITRKGWQVYRESKAKVTHCHGESAKQVPVESLVAMHRSQRIYAEKHFTIWGRCLTESAAIVGYGLRYAFAKSKDDRDRYRAAVGSWLGRTPAPILGRL